MILLSAHCYSESVSNIKNQSVFMCNKQFRIPLCWLLVLWCSFNLVFLLNFLFCHFYILFFIPLSMESQRKHSDIVCLSQFLVLSWYKNKNFNHTNIFLQWQVRNENSCSGTTLQLWNPSSWFQPEFGTRIIIFLKKNPNIQGHYTQKRITFIIILTYMKLQCVYWIIYDRKTMFC